MLDIRVKEQIQEETNDQPRKKDMYTSRELSVK